MNLRIQSTPNPLARKYILPEDVKAEGKVSYQEAEQCQHVPLAHALISSVGVRQVHFFENVITITQDGSQNWAHLDERVQQMITDTLPHHDACFVESLESPAPTREDLPDDVREVEEILDVTIRPSLQMDGGDVEVLAVEDAVITVRYLGACGGCPSAFEGTLQAMRYALSDGLGKDIEVVAV